MPNVARLLIYPVKSLDAQPVAEAELLASGAIMHDRAYAIVDAEGRWVNAKRHAAIHRLRSHLDIGSGRLTLRDQSARGLAEAIFHLHDERAALQAWLSDFFGFAVSLEEDRETGFPDDPDSPGPTIVGTATLLAIAEWFELPVDQVRARLRSNVEIDDAPMFWEDRLFGPEETCVPFSIGTRRLLGVNPCLRCVVPTRDPRTGAIYDDFTKRFIDERRATLPDWSARDRFRNFYRVAVNTRPQPGATPGTIRIGDAVALDEPALRVTAAADQGHA